MGNVDKQIGFRFLPFSRQQKKILTWWLPESGVSESEGIIADGAIRSGKTVCMALSFVMWSMATFRDEQFAMCGKTISSFRRNVMNPLKKMLYSRGYVLKEHRTDAMVEISRGDVTNSYYIFGGKDESSQDLIQGITLAGLLMDEVALMPRSFVEQATGRCSVTGSKFWFNCNPRGPEHWFKSEWLDKSEAKNLIHLRFRLEDNLSLSEEVIRRYKTMYTGVFYKRYILGEWCAAEGMIYPDYREAFEPRHERPGEDYALSIDYGTQNAFAALLWAKDGPTWHVIDEYRYSGRDTGRQKTDAQYLVDMQEFVRRIPKEQLERQIRNGGVLTIIDPSAASFIAALRTNSELFRVRKANNDVLDGIRDVASCMQLGKIKISDQCRELEKEFGGYVWEDDEKVDRPVKINDHLMDALRYFVRTKRLIKPEFVYQSRFGG